MNSEREALPLTIKQLRLIVDSLNEYYERQLNKVQPKELKPDEEDIYKGRRIKDRQRLGFIQETLQFVTLCYNIRIGQLNPDVAEAGGIPYDE